MDWLIRQGRYLFALALGASGCEHLICAYFRNPVAYIIPYFSGRPWFACFLGLALLVVSLSIAGDWKARLSATLLGGAFLLFFLFLWLPRMIVQPMDLSLRTVAFETLAFSGAALVFGGFPPTHRAAGTPRYDSGKVIRTGLYLFAISSVIFGIDHFLILRFIASLVPVWIPGAMFWAIFTGAGFIVAGVCMFTDRFGKLATFWLGTMFLLWFLLLHSPRVVIRPHNPNEWSSAFIALGMCGGSWICAGHFWAKQRGQASSPYLRS